MRALAATVGVFLALSGSASAAGGPAIPGGAFGGQGVTGAPRSPASEFRYVVGNGGARGSVVVKVRRGDGSVPQLAWLDGDWALPAVTLFGDAGGLSADGETLVLVKPAYGVHWSRTTLRILGTRRLKTVDRVILNGSFSFDAISPDGRTLYLVQYADPRDFLDYRVRAFDLSNDKLRPGQIVDPSNPDERMAGQPVDRRMSPDGRWAYTLYAGGRETFIHALDTEGATAVCVDLDEFDPNRAFRLGLDVDPAGGEISVTREGRRVATVDPRTFAVSDVAPTDAPAVDDPGVDGLGATAVAAGLVLLATAAGLLLRRHRRAAA